MTKNIKKYALIVLGAAIMAFGMYNVHRQCGITEGGALGLELLIFHWTGISPAITSFVFDTTLYLIGTKVIGKRFLLYAMIATVSYAGSYYIYEQFPYVLPNMANMPLLAAIIGALFVGCGCGLVVKIGGACGGDDALALVMSHFTKIPVGRCYLLSDITILVLSLSYIPFTKIVYSLVTVTLSSWLIGRIQEIEI